VRNDAAPHRWVVLHRHKKAWGLFWAGGGLDLCRDELGRHMGMEAASNAIVPATPEALLKLVLAFEVPEADSPLQGQPAKGKNIRSSTTALRKFSWKKLAIASTSCLFLVTGLLIASEIRAHQQNARLERLMNLLNESLR